MAAPAPTDSDGSTAPKGRERGAHSDGVSPGFRAAYAVRFGLAVVFGAFVAGLAVCALLASDLGTYSENVTILGSVQKWVLGAAAMSAAIQVALTGALVSGLALLASHKVAGPMVRLLGLLRGVAAGRLPGPVAFRRGDQVGQVEAEFNELSRSIRERHERVRTALREAQSAAQRLGAALDPPAHEEWRKAAADLRQRAEGLAALLAAAGKAR